MPGKIDIYRIVKTPIVGWVAWSTLVFGLILTLHFGLQNYAYDDAYIHIRIASHLVQYGQPYFNPGEPVNASSSPAWTLFVAAVMLVSGSHLNGMVIVAAVISFVGVIAFIALLNSEITLTLVDKIVLGAVYLAITLPSSIGWMETPLALLVISVGLLRYKREHADAAVFFALAPFIRPEFALLYIIVLCHVILRRRHWIGRFLAYSSLGAGPFLLYELYFFGTVIPQALVAKPIVYQLTYADTLDPVLSSFGPSLSLGTSHVNSAIISICVLFLGALPFAAYMIEAKRKSFSFLFVAVTLFGVGVLVSYVTGRTFMFPWYLPIYLIPLLAGFCLSVKRAYPRIIKSVVAVLAVPVLGIWVFAFLWISMSAAYPFLYPDFVVNARTRSYIRIGQELRRDYPHAGIMAAEIGGLGYAFPGYIWDGAGLVTPAALRYHPLQVPSQRSNRATGAIPNAFIQAIQPEIIVGMPNFLEDFDNNGDKTNYVLFRRPVFLPEDSLYAGQSLWGSSSIDIYIRRDILAGTSMP